jgi:hypothetical protein
VIIGIVGSRRRNSEADFEAVLAAFHKIYQPGDRIVSGGCPEGGDKFAEVIALMLAKPGHFLASKLLEMKPLERHRLIKENGAPIHIHPAEWGRLGKSAGHQRNTLIARDADRLIACVSADRKGGTEDSIAKFLKKKHVEDLILV